MASAAHASASLCAKVLPAMWATRGQASVTIKVPAKYEQKFRKKVQRSTARSMPLSAVTRAH